MVLSPDHKNNTLHYIKYQYGPKSMMQSSSYISVTQFLIFCEISSHKHDLDLAI